MRLPDVNVWLAAAWARHVHHARAKAWLDDDEGPLAFCRLTQMSLLRLVTNPAVTGKDALTRREAWDLVERFMADPRIRFLAEPDDLVRLWTAFSRRDDRDHLVWTDDYLAAFALGTGAELVTLDRPLRRRYPTVSVTVLD